MNDVARYGCSNCKDRGWIKTATYAERPYSTQYLVTRWLPCEHCEAALMIPRPENMQVSATSYVPPGVKPVPIGTLNHCGNCRNNAHKVVDVAIGPGHVKVEIPCFHCEALMFWPMCAAPPVGPKFDFALDLEEANRPEPRPNPRII
jgi:hypothetical protein